MTERECNYPLKVEFVIPITGLRVVDDAAPVVVRDPDELVTFSLTLPRHELEALYWWDMEASEDVEAKIERQLIEQGFRDEKYRKYDTE